MICRYDRESATYLTPEGDECRRDEHGDRTYHCTARRTCSQHVGQGELTCARCLGRTRQDIRAIAELATLMPVEALTGGVDSEAANVAGPHVDVRGWSARRVAMMTFLLAKNAAGKISDSQYVHARATMEDDDDRDPYVLLTKYHMMIAEDYRHPLPAKMTISDSARYLSDKLHEIAQDDGQDFPLLAREMRKCRQHLEAVLHNSSRAERGAPCPECASDTPAAFVRLQREYAHWCLDKDCERLHFATDEADRWVCPRKRDHVWSEAAYRAYVEERNSA